MFFYLNATMPGGRMVRLKSSLYLKKWRKSEINGEKARTQFVDILLITMDLLKMLIEIIRFRTLVFNRYWRVKQKKYK